MEILAAWRFMALKGILQKLLSIYFHSKHIEMVMIMMNVEWCACVTYKQQIIAEYIWSIKVKRMHSSAKCEYNFIWRSIFVIASVAVTADEMPIHLTKAPIKMET